MRRTNPEMGRIISRIATSLKHAHKNWFGVASSGLMVLWFNIILHTMLDGLDGHNIKFVIGLFIVALLTFMGLYLVRIKGNQR